MVTITSKTTEFTSSSVKISRARQHSTIAKSCFYAHAVFVGEHIDLRGYLGSSVNFIQKPAVEVLAGGGIAMLFRDGVVVFFDVEPDQQKTFLGEIEPLIVEQYEHLEIQKFRIVLEREAPESVAGKVLSLKEASVDRLQVVAAALSNSMVLARFELDLESNIALIKSFAAQLFQSGRAFRRIRLVRKHVGEAMLNDVKVTDRTGVLGRPDWIWNRTDLRQLYLNLENGLGLQRRTIVLERKLELTSRTIPTILDLLQNRRSARIEWCIAILLAAELILSLCQIAFH